MGVRVSVSSLSSFGTHNMGLTVHLCARNWRVVRILLSIDIRSLVLPFQLPRYCGGAAITEIRTDRDTTQGMDSKWCWEPEVGLLAPDLVIYLDMPVWS